MEETGRSSFLLLIIMIIGASNAKMMSDAVAANQTAGNQTAVNKPAANQTTAVPTGANQTAANQTAPAQPATNQTATNHTALSQAGPSSKFSDQDDDKNEVAMEDLAVLCRHNPITCFGRRRRSKTAKKVVRASDARQNINLDPLEEYLGQLDNRLTAVENATGDGTGTGKDLSAEFKYLKKLVKFYMTSVRGQEDALQVVEAKMDKLEAKAEAKMDQLQSTVEKLQTWLHLDLNSTESPDLNSTESQEDIDSQSL